MNDLTTFLDAWAEAERDRDAAATDRLLTDDFVGVGPVGFVLSKAAWLGRQAGKWRLAGIHFSFIAGTPGAPGAPAPS